MARRSPSTSIAINTICAALVALADRARDWAEQGAGSALAVAGEEWASALETLVHDLENQREPASALRELAAAHNTLLAALCADVRAAIGLLE